MSSLVYKNMTFFDLGLCFVVVFFLFLFFFLKLGIGRNFQSLNQSTVAQTSAKATTLVLKTHKIMPFLV